MLDLQAINVVENKEFREFVSCGREDVTERDPLVHNRFGLAESMQAQVTSGSLLVVHMVERLQANDEPNDTVNTFN
jgi:hypothetical protein